MSTVLFSATNARPWLARLDPRVKLLYVFAASVGSASAGTTTELWTLFGATLLVASGLRLSPRGWAAILGIVGLTVWGTMLSQGFFYKVATNTVLLSLVAPSGIDASGTESGGFPGVELTKEGLQYGAEQSLRLLATLLAGLTVSLSTSPERMLAALTWFRLPATLSFMTTAALRFLPLLLEEAAEVRQARRLRGYRFRIVGLPGDRLGSYKAEIGIVLPVIAAALRRAEALAESVTARGFDSHRARTCYPPLAMRGREKLAAALLVAASIAMIAARVRFR